MSTPSCHNVMCAQLKCQHNQILKTAGWSEAETSQDTMYHTTKPHNNVCPASPCKRKHCLFAVLKGGTTSSDCLREHVCYFQYWDTKLLNAQKHRFLTGNVCSPGEVWPISYTIEEQEGVNAKDTAIPSRRHRLLCCSKYLDMDIHEQKGTPQLQHSSSC